MRYKTLGLFCACLLLCGLVISACATREEPVDYKAILSRVHEGDERQQALQALSDAWYHSECTLLYGHVEDTFLYGPRDRDRVTIIGVYSKPQGGKLVVDHTGVYENYFLDDPDFGEHCRPPLQKAFEQDRALETQSP